MNPPSVALGLKWPKLIIAECCCEKINVGNTNKTIITKFFMLPPKFVVITPFTIGVPINIHLLSSYFVELENCNCTFYWTNQIILDVIIRQLDYDTYHKIVISMNMVFIFKLFVDIF